MQVLQEKQVHIATVPTILPELVPNSAFTRPINAVYEGTKQSLRMTLESLFSAESIVLLSELVLEPFILGTLFIFDNGLGRTQYFGSYGSAHLDRYWYVFGVWENYLIIGLFISCIIFPIYCRFFVYPIACELELGEDDVSQEWYFRFRLACVELFDFDPDEYDDLLFIVCIVFTVPYVLYRFPHYIRKIKYENDVDEVEGTFNIPWKEVKHYDKILQEVELHARSTYLKDIYAELKLKDDEILAKESFYTYLVNYAKKTAFFYKVQMFFFSNPLTLMDDVTGQLFSHYRNYLVLSIPHRRTPIKSRKASQYLRTFLEHPAPVLTMYDRHLNTDFYTLAEHLRLCGGYEKMHKKKGPDRRIFPSVKSIRHLGILDVFEDAHVLYKITRWQRMDKYTSIKRALFEANIHCSPEEEDDAIDDGIHDYSNSDYLLDDEDEDDELRVITALNRFTGTPGDIMEFIVDQTTEEAADNYDDKFIERFFYRLKKHERVRFLQSGKNKLLTESPSSRTKKKGRKRSFKKLFNSVFQVKSKKREESEKLRSTYIANPTTRVTDIHHKVKSKSLARCRGYETSSITKVTTWNTDFHGHLLVIGFEHLSNYMGASIKLRRKSRYRDLVFLDFNNQVQTGQVTRFKAVNSLVLTQIYGDEWQMLLKAAENHFVYNLRKTQFSNLKTIFTQMKNVRQESQLLETNPLLVQQDLQTILLGIPTTSQNIGQGKSKLGYSYVDLYEFDPETISELILDGHLNPLQLKGNLLEELIVNNYLEANLHKEHGYYLRKWVRHPVDLMEKITTCFDEDPFDIFYDRLAAQTLLSEDPIRKPFVIPYVNEGLNPAFENFKKRFISKFNDIFFKINKTRSPTNLLSHHDILTYVLSDQSSLLKKHPAMLQIDEFAYLYELKELAQTYLYERNARGTIEDQLLGLSMLGVEDDDDLEATDFSTQILLDEIVTEFMVAENEFLDSKLESNMTKRPNIFVNLHDHMQTWSLGEAIENFSAFNITFPELEQIFVKKPFQHLPLSARMEALDRYVISTKHLLNKVFIFEEQLALIHKEILSKKMKKEALDINGLIRDLYKLDIPTFIDELTMFDTSYARSVSNVGLTSYYCRSYAYSIPENEYYADRFFNNMYNIYDTYKPGFYDYSLQVKDIFLEQNKFKLVPITPDLVSADYWDNFSRRYNISKDDFLNLYSETIETTFDESPLLRQTKNTHDVLFPLLGADVHIRKPLVTFLEALKQYKDVGYDQTLVPFKDASRILPDKTILKFEYEGLKLLKKFPMGLGNDFPRSFYGSLKEHDDLMGLAFDLNISNLRKINELLENEEELSEMEWEDLERTYLEYEIPYALQAVIEYKKQLLHGRNRIYEADVSNVDFNNNVITVLEPHHKNLMKLTTKKSADAFEESEDGEDLINNSTHLIKRLLNNVCGFLSSEVNRYQDNYHITLDLAGFLKLLDKEGNLEDKALEKRKLQEQLEEGRLMYLEPFVFFGTDESMPVITRDQFIYFHFMQGLLMPQIRLQQIEAPNLYFDFSKYFLELDNIFINSAFEDFDSNALFYKIRPTIILSRETEHNEKSFIEKFGPGFLKRQQIVTEVKFTFDDQLFDGDVSSDFVSFNITNNLCLNLTQTQSVLASKIFLKFSDTLYDDTLHLVSRSTKTLDADIYLEEVEYMQQFSQINDLKNIKYLAFLADSLMIQVDRVDIGPEEVLSDFAVPEESINIADLVNLEPVNFFNKEKIDETLGDINYLRENRPALYWRPWNNFRAAVITLKEHRNTCDLHTQTLIESLNLDSEEISALAATITPGLEKRNYTRRKINKFFDTDFLLYEQNNIFPLDFLIKQPFLFIKTLTNRTLIREYLHGSLKFNLFQFKKPVILQALQQTLLKNTENTNQIPSFVYVNEFNNIVTFDEKKLTYLIYNLTANSLLTDDLKTTLNVPIIDIKTSTTVEAFNSLHLVNILDRQSELALKTNYNIFRNIYNLGRRIAHSTMQFLVGPEYREYMLVTMKSADRGFELSKKALVLSNFFFKPKTELRKKYLELQLQYWRKPVGRPYQSAFILNKANYSDAARREGTPLEIDETTMYPDVLNSHFNKDMMNDDSVNRLETLLDGEGVLYAFQQRNPKVQFNLQTIRSNEWQEQFFSDFIEVDHISFSDTYLDFRVLDYFLPRTKTYLIDFSRFLALAKDKKKGIRYDHFFLEKSLKTLNKENSLQPVTYIDNFAYLEEMSDGLTWDALIGAALKAEMKGKVKSNYLKKDALAQKDFFLNNNVHGAYPLSQRDRPKKLNLSAFITNYGHKAVDLRYRNQFVVHEQLLQNNANIFKRIIKRFKLKKNSTHDIYFPLTKKIMFKPEVLDNFIFTPVKSVEIDDQSASIETEFYDLSVDVLPENILNPLHIVSKLPKNLSLLSRPSAYKFDDLLGDTIDGLNYEVADLINIFKSFKNVDDLDLIDSEFTTDYNEESLLVGKLFKHSRLVDQYINADILSLKESNQYLYNKILEINAVSLDARAVLGMLKMDSELTTIQRENVDHMRTTINAISNLLIDFNLLDISGTQINIPQIKTLTLNELSNFKYILIFFLQNLSEFADINSFKVNKPALIIPNEFQYSTNDYVNLSTFEIPNTIHYKGDYYPTNYKHNLYSLFFINDIEFLAEVSSRLFFKAPVNFSASIINSFFDFTLAKQLDLPYEKVVHDLWDVSRQATGELSFKELDSVHGKYLVKDFNQKIKMRQRLESDEALAIELAHPNFTKHGENLFEDLALRKIITAGRDYTADLKSSSRFQLNALDNDLTKLLHNISYGKTAEEIFQNYDDLFSYYQDFTDNYSLTRKLNEKQYLFNALHRSLILDTKHFNKNDFIIQFSEKIEGVKQIIKYVDYYNTYLPEYPILALEDLYQDVIIMAQCILYKIQLEDTEQKEVDMLYDFLFQLVDFYGQRLRSTESEFIKNHNYLVSTFNLKNVDTTTFSENLSKFDLLNSEQQKKFINFFSLGYTSSTTNQPVKVLVDESYLNEGYSRTDDYAESINYSYQFGEPNLLLKKSHFHDWYTRGETVRAEYLSPPAPEDDERIPPIPPFPTKDAKSDVITFLNKVITTKMEAEDNDEKATTLLNLKKRIFYSFYRETEKSRNKVKTPKRLVTTFKDFLDFTTTEGQKRMLTRRYPAKKDDFHNKLLGPASIFETDQEKLKEKLETSVSSFWVPNVIADMVDSQYFLSNDKQAELLYSSQWYKPKKIQLSSAYDGLFKQLIQKFERNILTDKKIVLDFDFDFSITQLPFLDHPLNTNLLQHAFSEFSMLNQDFSNIGFFQATKRFKISGFEQLLLPVDDLFVAHKKQKIKLAPTQQPISGMLLKTRSQLLLTILKNHYSGKGRYFNANLFIHDINPADQTLTKFGNLLQVAPYYCNQYRDWILPVNSFLLEQNKKEKDLFHTTFDLVNTRHFKPHSVKNRQVKLELDLLNADYLINTGIRHFDSAYFKYLFRRRRAKRYKKLNIERRQAIVVSHYHKSVSSAIFNPKNKLTNKRQKHKPFGVHAWHKNFTLTDKMKTFGINVYRYEHSAAHFPFFNRNLQAHILEKNLEVDLDDDESEDEEDDEVVDSCFEASGDDVAIVSSDALWGEDYYHTTAKRGQLSIYPYTNIKTVHDTVLLSGLYTAQQLTTNDFSMLTNGSAIFTPYDLFGIYLDSTYGHTPDSWVSVFQPETYAVLDINPYNPFIFSDGLQLRRFYGYGTDKSLISKINSLPIMKDIEGIVTGNFDSLSTLGVEYSLTLQFQKYFGILPNNVLEAFVYGTYAMNNWVSALHQSMFIENYLTSFTNIDELMSMKEYLGTPVQLTRAIMLDECFYRRNEKFDDFFNWTEGDYEFFHFSPYLRLKARDITLADRIIAGKHDGLISRFAKTADQLVRSAEEPIDNFSEMWLTKIKDDRPPPGVVYPKVKIYLKKAENVVVGVWAPDVYWKFLQKEPSFSHSAKVTKLVEILTRLNKDK